MKKYTVIAPIVFILGLLLAYYVFGVGQEQYKPMDYGSSGSFDFKK